MPLLELLYAATVFLSAFLLFQIQPMIAKMILPWFGGASSVWSTCMVFFQMVLLLGYLYAHWLKSSFLPRRASLIHTFVVGASLLALPIVANPVWKPTAGDSPSLRILGLLAATVGLPYFVVSTTSSLLQASYARTHHGAIPYRLFALSNLASMLALVTYPLLFEPDLATRTQGYLWSGAYACFAVLCLSTLWLGARLAPGMGSNESDAGATAVAPDLVTRLLWVGLAACASILLLAMTTFLTQDVAAIPFLWVIPLAVYLLSFILCFGSGRAYQRKFYLPLTVLGLIATANRAHPSGWHPRLIPTLAILTVSLFAFCMFCHGELVSRKPHPRHLTGFYVMVSLGGALGGLFVGLIAPNFFNAYYEFPMGLVLCAALLVGLAPVSGKFLQPAMLALFTGYVIYVGMGVRMGVRGYLTVERNFYGQLRVSQEGAFGEEDAYRVLMHGIINHGEQMLTEPYRRMPITYFCAPSGIGRLMAARKIGPQRVGIMGMGCGTLAAYGRAGDTLRIYEINPQVLPIANTMFSYLKDTAAKVETVLGDARLSLEREPTSEKFDLLVMDAFSGDSVPVHLITREAFAMYFERLNPGGLVAVNVSNKYLDLRPVMERAASAFGKIALYYSYTPGDDDYYCYSSGWIILADPSIRETSPQLVRSGELLKPYPNFRIWTDDFSSMWDILR